MSDAYRVAVTSRNRLFVILFQGFVLLGVPLAAMGVAWPSAAAEFSRPIGDLGIVTFAFVGLYTLSTLGAGGLTRRFGASTLLVSSALLAAASLLGMATAAAWYVFLAATALFGLAGGQVDAGTNSYMAIHRGPRAMGAIHAGFGLGTIVGPLAVTILLGAGLSWRLAFLLLAGLQLTYAIGLFYTGGDLPAVVDDQLTKPRVGARVELVVLSILTFFIYAGMASGAGTWSFTVMTEEWGISTAGAGLAVTGYWAGFTGSRILLGLVGDRFPPNRVLRWSVLATLGFLVLFWLSPAPWIGVVGLIAAGFAHGPVFPFQVLITPRRFGPILTPSIVGYQIAAANVGGGAFAVAIGFMVNAIGLQVVAPALVMMAIGLVVVVEMLRVATDRRPRAPHHELGV